MAENELANKLRHRTDIIDRDEAGLQPEPVRYSVKRNVYAEFAEFTRKQIQAYQKMFDKYDTSRDKFIDQGELQYMMEKLEAPQTFLALKAMIREVDEDKDGQISFREFLLIFSKAEKGELEGSGLKALTDCVDFIDVDVEGVKGAADFFQNKITELTKNNKFADEIREEQEERKRAEEDSRTKRAAFKAKAAMFGTSTGGD